MNPIQDLVTGEVTPARVLRNAARYIATFGWFQGATFADPSQPCPPACAIGAIRHTLLGDTQPFTEEALADGRSALLCDTVDVLCMYLINSGAVTPNPDRLIGLPHLPEVADWNDDPIRNVAQVLAALHAAAQEWDRHHPGGGQ